MATTTKESAGGQSATLEAPPRPRLRERYLADTAPALHEEFGYDNVMQIPGLAKIVVDVGVGEAARDAKLIDGAVRDLSLIAGQKRAVDRAKKWWPTSSCARACRSART